MLPQNHIYGTPGSLRKEVFQGFLIATFNYILYSLTMEEEFTNTQTEQNKPAPFSRIAEELDFYRIRESISHLCSSEEGQLFLNSREPLSSVNEYSPLKEFGREWNSYLHEGRRNAISSWPPVKDYFKILGVEGAQLLQEQILSLGLFCDSVIACKESLIQAGESLNIPHLTEEASSLPELNEAQRLIFQVLTHEGEVKDLPSLREIRARIASLHKEIENAMRRHLADANVSQALQSAVPALRAGRELLAVRSDRRGAVNGIVHEVSPSGQTVYIEPDDVVRANNELVQEEFALQQEIRKIFLELTEKLSAFKSDFENAHKTMLLLDSTMAAAKWQKETEGIFAEDIEREKEAPVILGARHPLLGKKAVPVDIKFMEGKNVLIITGPNTGGKTVTLKTIALFALLNQAGFPIPALEGTKLPCFGSIFADIGDEQSIDQSLSTFSAHMKKTGDMLLHADEKSLILLDELGSGTDPQEGGALAMATLDTLINKGSFVIVTTHHGILKNYGYTNDKCINASVEFNSDTLKPTYRLLMGVPGESHALEIASHSGIPQAVIEKARGYITNQQADVSTLITGLTKKHEEADTLLKETKSQAEKIAAKELKLKERELELKEKELTLKEIERTNSSAFLSETRSKLENLVRVLREGEITKEKTTGVKNFIQEFEEQVEEKENELEAFREKLLSEKDSLEKEVIAQNGMRLSQSKSHSKNSKKTKARTSNKEALKNAEPLTPRELKSAEKKEKKETLEIKPFESGMEVLAGREKRKGTLLQKTRGGQWLVQFGSLKMSVPESQLMRVKDSNEKAKTADVEIILSKSENSENDRPKFELRLLGMRMEEAMKAVMHQMDVCALTNFKNFSIIHGKGNGVLQQAVHDYLSHYPGVKDFHFAAPEDGGSGKTYVTLF